MTTIIVLSVLIVILIYVINKYGEVPIYTEEEQKERGCTCNKAHSYECKCEDKLGEL